MNKFLESIMSFINENTTLLIVICVFLIFVLIGYLIDNSIKTKKLAKMEGNVDKENIISNETPDVKENLVDNTKTVSEPKEEIKVEEVKVVQEVATEGSVVSENPVISSIDKSVEEPVVSDKEVEENIVVPESITEAEDINVKELEPVEVKANEFEVDPAINELLNKDFSKQDNVINYDTEFDNEEISLSPIDGVSKVESPEPKEEKSKYKNEKSLSEIFGKKSVDTVKEDKKELLNTVDFQNELDRILQKLNDESDNEVTKDSTLDETQDFSNMF